MVIITQPVWFFICCFYNNLIYYVFEQVVTNSPTELKVNYPWMVCCSKFRRNQIRDKSKIFLSYIWKLAEPMLPVAWSLPANLADIIAKINEQKKEAKQTRGQTICFSSFRQTKIILLYSKDAFYVDSCIKPNSHYCHQF